MPFDSVKKRLKIQLEESQAQLAETTKEKDALEAALVKKGTLTSKEITDEVKTS